MNYKITYIYRLTKRILLSAGRDAVNLASWEVSGEYWEGNVPHPHNSQRAQSVIAVASITGL